MGREIVLKKIRSSSIRAMVLGGVTFALFAAFAFILYVGEVPALATFVLVMSLLMLVVLIIGVRNFCNPDTYTRLKKNPQLLEQADSLYANIKYQDNFIIMSEKYLGSVKDVTQIISLSEVIRVYEKTSTYNFVSTDHRIIVSCPNYTVEINVYGKKREIIDDLVWKISSNCPKLHMQNVNQ